MRCVVQKKKERKRRTILLQRTRTFFFPIRQFEVMRIVLPRTRYWEGPEERAETGTRSHKYEERDEGASAGTREMIAGPVR
ncbi:hypothetical protein ALC56_08670 [Trachymyrmex septentrionalis]|uniref:Uncharacterized protein n=1 Tax=Trachymyrmex septentrionalis TaxID=34720 RepID=A0A195FA06_9HYME|nr:hypothetical protein ALC56_08670 [Trachymyrmex septentrionalis]